MLATVQNVLVRMGVDSVDATTHAQIEALIEDASGLVTAYAGRVWTTGDVPPTVAGVVAGMVRRAVENPSGATQQTAGPFSVSYGSQAAQRLFLTVGEKRTIAVAAGRRGLGRLTIDRGPLETPPARP